MIPPCNLRKGYPQANGSHYSRYCVCLYCFCFRYGKHTVGQLIINRSFSTHASLPPVCHPRLFEMSLQNLGAAWERGVMKSFTPGFHERRNITIKPNHVEARFYCCRLGSRCALSHSHQSRFQKHKGHRCQEKTWPGIVSFSRISFARPSDRTTLLDPSKAWHVFQTVVLCAMSYLFVLCFTS